MSCWSWFTWNVSGERFLVLQICLGNLGLIFGCEVLLYEQWIWDFLHAINVVGSVIATEFYGAVGFLVNDLICATGKRGSGEDCELSSTGLAGKMGERAPSSDLFGDEIPGGSMPANKSSSRSKSAILAVSPTSRLNPVSGSLATTTGCSVGAANINLPFRAKAAIQVPASIQRRPRSPYWQAKPMHYR